MCLTNSDKHLSGGQIDITFGKVRYRIPDSIMTSQHQLHVVFNSTDLITTVL